MSRSSGKRFQEFLDFIDEKEQIVKGRLHGRIAEYQLRRIYEDKSIEEYQQLFQSITKGDWNRVEVFLEANREKHPAAITESITESSNTPLMVAVMSKQSEDFLKKMLHLISKKDDLVKTNKLGNTALHEAAIVGHVEAVQLLVRRETSLLTKFNKDGYLPLHSAAIYGQRKILFYFLSKNVGDKRQIQFSPGSFAMLLHLAINARLFDVALYLLDLNKNLACLHPTKDVPLWKTMAQETFPFPTGTLEKISGGLSLLGAEELFPFSTETLQIISRRLDLLGKESSHAVPSRTHVESRILVGLDIPSPLETIAEDPSAFCSGTHFKISQRFIYNLRCCDSVPVEFKSFQPDGDEENPHDEVRQKFRATGRWKTLKIRRKISAGATYIQSAILHFIFMAVPLVKHIKDTKEMHHQADEVIKRLCKQVTHSHDSSATAILKRSFLLAAQHGIKEIVEEILVSHPDAIDDFLDEEGHSALHFAVMYRHEMVLNIIIQRSISLKNLSLSEDQNGNNILHLAGYRAHQQRLDLVSGAVIQMQRELQWYKAVENFVPVQATKAKNHDEKTPLMVFNDEHSDMIKTEGEWMVGMATSCTVATTIIATIAFAAAITVPGGNNNQGLPMFSKDVAFMIFSISNALALFSSITTMLSFLSILTSRYAVIDFLHTLPNRLIIGLVFLFSSVMSMIISFTAILYLVFPHKYTSLMVALAGLPVSMFMFLQIPLLLNMMKSTYRRSIFSPQV